MKHSLKWLSGKNREQFTKQLVYYLGAFAGGIPVRTQDYKAILSFRLLSSYYCPLSI
jgi:hypothetical protein